MKKLIQTISALGAFGAFSLFAQAQPVAPRIAVIDIAKIYDGHYETIAQNAKLKADTAKAQEQIDELNKEGQALVEQYKETVEQAKNPTATPDAKAKYESDAKNLGAAIQAKEKDINDLANTAKQTFQQRIQTFRNQMMQEISGVAIEVARRKGITLLIDKSGPSLIGIPPVIYADPSYDITDDVAAEINKNRPPPMPPMPGAAPAPAESSSGSSDSTKITVPGITP
jgi:outer membrane protein